VCYLYFAREAAGAVGTRHSPRPLLGERLTHHSGASRRENAELCLPSLRGAKRPKQSTLLFAAPLWIASRSLSSGAHSRDPVARNDNFNTLCF
jgi:hypothetical protein